MNTLYKCRGAVGLVLFVYLNDTFATDLRFLQSVAILFKLYIILDRLHSDTALNL